MPFAAVPESDIGTSRRFVAPRNLVATGGIADRVKPHQSRFMSTRPGDDYSAALAVLPSKRRMGALGSVEKDHRLHLCPSCQSAAFGVLDPSPKSPATSRASRPARGAYRDRHGRWARDAVDALATRDERCVRRTAKSCGPDAPTLVSSFAEAMSALMGPTRRDPRDDGGKRARSPGRARRKPLKPLRREC